MKVWKAQLDTDFKESLTLKDSAGTVFDLTGYTTTAECRKQRDGQLLATASITVTDAAAGQVEVEFTDTQINDIGKGRHVVDLKVVDGSGTIFRTETAELIVRGRVTA